MIFNATLNTTFNYDSLNFKWLILKWFLNGIKRKYIAILIFNNQFLSGKLLNETWLKFFIAEMH
jgi:hypothetical protein